MLKNIPACISPDLMHILMSTGHGDEIVLADADFPAVSYSQRLVRADGLKTATLLDAILKFFPLDTYVKEPVLIMDASEWRQDEPPYYQEFRSIIKQHDSQFSDFDYVKRFDFYEKARTAFAVIATGEPEGNLILKKGCVS
ncbi:MAG: RbsD/FucU family protein [Planctomycetota bacterium]|jgi:L-fucose mutarotase